MPTATCPIPEANVLYARCYGHLAPDDIIGWEVESNLKATENGQFITLVDLSDITGTDMTFDDINSVYGKLVRHYQPRKQRLLLVLYAPDDLAFGMTRILQSLSGMTEHIEVQIFQNPLDLQDYLPDVPVSLADLKEKVTGPGSPCSA